MPASKTDDGGERTMDVDVSAQCRGGDVLWNLEPPGYTGSEASLEVSS